MDGIEEIAARYAFGTFLASVGISLTVVALVDAFRKDPFRDYFQTSMRLEREARLSDRRDLQAMADMKEAHLRREIESLRRELRAVRDHAPG